MNTSYRFGYNSAKTKQKFNTLDQFICFIYRNIAILKFIMGITKKELFTAHDNRIASYFKALGHPARIAILNHLITLDGCCCNDLVEETGLAQATVSQHLKALKELDIIQGSVEGKNFCYCINPETWQHLNILLTEFINHKIKPKNTCC